MRCKSEEEVTPEVVDYGSA